MNNRNFSIFTLLLAVFGLFNFNTAKAGELPEEKFTAKEMIMHHISDSHDWHLWGHTSIPLPVILYSKEGGFDMFMSSEFQHDDAGTVLAKGKYLKHHGHIYLANADGTLSYGDKHPHAPGGAKQLDATMGEEPNGNEQIAAHSDPEVHNANLYPVNVAPLDFSITRNVASIFITMLLLVLIFGAVARSYDKNGVARGIGSFLEPIIVFVRDEIAIPNIGEKKYAKYLPYLLTVFFFIWVANLMGLVPFFPGGSNVTGNISVTFVLAVITYLITTISGNKDYWMHIFWMPGVPVAIRPILAVIELIGTLTKPFALMMRLFANIAAGHILILALIALIFMFKTYFMSAVSIPFVVFMSTLELLVAALQAYIFTLLSALFIGMAVAEHDHGHEHGHDIEHLEGKANY
ncbi:F0F1 ATP synthase subunit A [soil metagenome]